MHTDSWLERGITTVVDAQLIVKGYPSKDSLATNTLKTVLDVDIWPKKDSALASLVTRCRSAIHWNSAFPPHSVQLQEQKMYNI